jgi:NADH-quinone oxidoreductase subunit C
VILERLTAKFPSHVLKSEVSLGDAVIWIPKEGAKGFFNTLKVDAELAFDFLVSLTAVDWLDLREVRFELVYHLMSHKTKDRLRVKIDIPESNPEAESVTSIWNSANFLEREVFDMYGIKFKGHPDLRRILMYDEFEGHPLRKDYPVQGKQPRIQLLHPEVRNTAVDMRRPSLVSINKRRANAS